MLYLKKLIDYIFNAIFIVGWAGFYYFFMDELVTKFIPGNLDSGKLGLNFYVYSVLYIIIVIWYSVYFNRYYCNFFYDKVSLTKKALIIFKCVTLALLWYLILGFVAVYASGIFGWHMDYAFWYEWEEIEEL